MSLKIRKFLVIFLREKVDEFWIQANYGITEFDLLEEDSFVVNGNREKFEEDYAFILDNDLSQAAAYNQAKQRFDVENLVDYWVAQTAISNANRPHNNLKLWRERSDEGIWRYLLFDMDVSMERHPWTAAEINLLKDRLDEPQPGPHHNIMRSFLENPEFKRYFINRYADLLNTTFHPEYWKAAVDEIEAELDSEMQRHFAR